MRRVFIALLLAGCTLAARPAHPGVRRRREPESRVPADVDAARRPVVQRMMYFVQAGDQYPLLPNGRPLRG